MVHDKFVMSNIPAVPNILDLYKGFVRAASLPLSFIDQLGIQMANMGPLPPVHLRARVHGRMELDGFLGVGQRCVNDLDDALRSVGKNFTDFSDILDFGCGCGRAMIWLHQKSPASQIYGTDIDSEATDWCSENFPWAKCGSNDPKPPLAYEDGQFDLAYAISVFTHLDEEFQFLWLEELKRVIRPGGHVLITLHGYDIWKKFSPEEVEEIKTNGIGVVYSSFWAGIFPEWYQNTYHDRNYVESRFDEYFEVANYLPLALDNNHDIVVLRRRDN